MTELIKKRPLWLRIKPWGNENYALIKKTLKKFKIYTVCESCMCPNMGVCWERKNATIMILGNKCTRRCAFCGVEKLKRKGFVDYTEPIRVANAIKEWGIKYAVITSVTRDDLKDGGAGIYAETIRKIKEICNDIFVEVLIPDYSKENLKTIISEKPYVLSHNIESVERLFRVIKDKKASYRKSLKVLYEAKKINSSTKTKSALMLGLGEREDEVIKTMQDLRNCGVEYLVIGQYLQPSLNHYPLKEYIHPEKFKKYKEIGESMGFELVYSHPFARSSYIAFRIIQTQ